ncbi:MAG TPA: DNA polymerase III subunit gamma/tau [Candidatus Sabulitectum sp.]|nr:DNA polymerase III subunit gamma/tau [Candidatus Sabulitectum sp.]
MSYLVFARKWRPQTFSDVIAQEHVTMTLKNAIESERIGHAYLFTGPRGVGKTTTARILAKALNCVKGPTPDPCMECEACRRIAAGGHLDVLEIDGASNRGIDEIRDLREKARYAAAEGGYKIYIIDEVHMLTREAFNALLKILEEPPDRVIFIFATTEPRKVPATILSRCQRFDFRRIPSSVMGEYISREASGEGITITQDALSLVCRASGGSMRDALSIMDQLVSFSGGSISGDSVSRLLGLVEADLLADISSAVFHSQGSRALELVEDALVRGYSIEELIDALNGFLRNALLASAGAEKGINDLSDGELELVRSTVAGIADVHVLNVLRLLSGAAEQIRLGASPRVSVEGALLTASKLGIAFGINELPPVTERVSVKAVLLSGVEPEGKKLSEPEPAAEEEPEDEPAEEPRSAEEVPEEGGETREKEKEVIREISGLFDMIPESE